MRVFPASFLLKEQLHVAALQKCDMWSVNPFSSHPTVFSQSRDGVQVGGEGEEKSGEKESF